MTESTMNALVEAGEDMGFTISARDDYSGRCMYGKTTCAVVFDSFGTLAACAAAAAADWTTHGADADVDEFIRDLKGLRLDSMGRGHVAY
jgi:hypothetical protein